MCLEAAARIEKGSLTMANRMATMVYVAWFMALAYYLATST